MSKSGRPNGRMIHAEGVEALLAARNILKRDLSAEADITPQFLSDLLAHRSGASDAVVDRISGALGVKPAAIFPEIAGWVSPLPDRDAKRKTAAA